MIGIIKQKLLAITNDPPDIDASCFNFYGVYQRHCDAIIAVVQNGPSPESYTVCTTYLKEKTSTTELYILRTAL